MSSISGSMLIRSGSVSIDHFSAEVSDHFPYPRSIFVPIDLPPNYERAVRSAARRALGPVGDIMEKSGVAFVMRCIGARSAVASSEKVRGILPPNASELSELSWTRAALPP